jgi:type IV pilus assembly protein PilM
VPTIAEEVDRTIAFYNSSHQEQPLNSTVPMLVCGDLVEVPDSWPTLAGKSGCPVSILPSPVESPPGFKANDFIINIGLAFKELLLEKEGDNFSLVNINTLPETYLPKPVHLPNIIAPIGIVIGAGILIYMGFLVYNRASHTDALRSELDPFNSNIAQEHSEISSLEEQVELLEPQFAGLAAITNIFDNTFTSLGTVRNQINGDLQQIASVLPGDVSLTDLNHMGDALRVWGIASDEDDIFEYARQLRASGRFSVVIISAIEAVEVDEMFEEFEFEFLLK